MASLLIRSEVQPAVTARSAWMTWGWWLLRLAVDAGLVQVAFLAAYWLRFSVQPVVDDYWRPLDDFTILRLLLMVFIVGALHSKGLYRLGRGAGHLDEAAGVASGVTVGFGLTIVASVALRIPFDSRAILVYSWALTIVALLFGLLKVNPTPFCVLDEVDAALDEANVQRFAELLARFARQIQFVVVTHNRATMEMADALYGVSMDQHGVSRVLAIRPREVALAG